MSSELELQLKLVEATLLDDPQNQELLLLKTELEEVIKLEIEVKNNKELTENLSECVQTTLLNDPQNQELLQLKNELEEVIQLESEVKNNKELENLPEYIEYFGNAKSEQKEISSTTLVRIPIRGGLIREALQIKEEPIPSRAPIIEIDATSIPVEHTIKVKPLFNRRIPQWAQRFALANYILENPNFADWPRCIIGSLRTLNEIEQRGKLGANSYLLIGKNGQQVRVLIQALPSDIEGNFDQLPTYEFNITSPLALSILRNKGIMEQAKAKITFDTKKNTCCVKGTRRDIVYALKLIRISLPFSKYPALTMEQVNLVLRNSPDSPTSNYTSDVPRIISYGFVVPRINRKTLIEPPQKFLMKIERMTKALVDVQSKICFLAGTQSQIDKAVAMIKRRFLNKTGEKNYIPAPHDLSVYEFPVSGDFLVRFSGKKGKNSFLKKISKRTNATVGIRTQFTPSNERTFFLTGTRIQIEKALKMIRNAFPQEKFPQMALDRGHYVD